MSRSDVDIVIIGAGAAGLAAAQHLAARPVTCLVVEAAGRICGRALTRHGEGGVPLDLGCGWLHSADRNPWTRIAERSGFTVDRTPPSWGTQACDQGMSADEQTAFHAAYGAWEQRVLRWPEPLPCEDCPMHHISPRPSLEGRIGPRRVALPRIDSPKKLIELVETVRRRAKALCPPDVSVSGTRNARPGGLPLVRRRANGSAQPRWSRLRNVAV